MAKRQCDECKTTMQSFWPRKRVDGKMLCPACAKTPRGGYVSAEPKTASDDSIHFGPEDMDFFRQMRDVGEMRSQMHDHAQKRVVNLEDPHDLKQHLIEAHGWTDDDFDDGDEGHISHDEMYNGHHQDHDDYAQDFPTASTMSGSHFHQASLGSAGDDDNLYHLSGCHHTSLGRVLGFHTAALSDQEQEERLRAWRAPDPAMEPVRHVIEGARSYASKVGLPDPHDQPYHQIEQTPERIRALGRDYDRLPMNDPAAHPHFEAMRREINHQYEHLTNTMGVKVEPVDHDPYGSVHDMAHDLATNKRLKVLRTAVTGGHPFFTDDENDKFRAVHDAFGHAATGRGFDRHGEEAAWVAHSKMFSPQARPAMTSETRGQNGYLILNGTFGPQKVALLPKDHWMMDQAHHLGSMRVIAHDSGDGETIYHCPFCGSGQVVARSDGTVECDFCHTAFTVQVQPEMNAFPQTINGQPVDVPGMPGEIDSQDPLDPNGSLPGAEDDAPDDGSGSDNPFAGGDSSSSGGDDSTPDDSGEDDDSGSKPPFQASLSAEDRVYRLAIQNAPADQRMAVIAAVREMRKRK